MTPIQITLPDQLAVVARSAGLLSPENIAALLQQQLQSGNLPADSEAATDDAGGSRGKAALERLIEIARGDTGQSRRVADFLLAWWNAGSCGAFELTSLWALDAAIAKDLVLVFEYICVTAEYPDALDYKEEFAQILRSWRPELQ